MKSLPKQVLHHIPAACVVLRLEKGGELYCELSNHLNDLWTGKGALTGRNMREAFPEFHTQKVGDRTLFQIIEGVFRTGERFEIMGVPVMTLDTQGREKTQYLNTTIEPISDDHEVSRVLIFSVDVTDEVMAKNALERAVRLRDEFISVASHELRTPVSTLLLLAETLQKLMSDVDLAAVRPRVLKLREALKRQSQLLSRLVDEMLDVPRLQSGKAELNLFLERWDLAQIVQATCSKFAEPAEQAKCSLTFDLAPVYGLWDERYVTQVVANYIGNAIKYGAGRPVHIRTFEDGDTAVLTVRDHGPGVKPEDQKRIFEKFERAVPIGTYRGLGLGLWIAGRAAALLKGTVSVGPPTDGGPGSQFELRLPKESSND